MMRPRSSRRGERGRRVEAAGERESAEATLAVPAALRAKRRSDFGAAMPISLPAAAPATSVAANGDDAGPAERPAPVPAARPSVAPATSTAPGADNAAPTPSPPPRHRIDVEPALKVVSGAKAGRIVALVKDETLIGRAGVQVVALRRAPDELRVVPVEGESPPSVNGVEVVPEGQSLAVGDVLEIAGTKLEVIAAMKRTSG